MSFSINSQTGRRLFKHPLEPCSGSSKEAPFSQCLRANPERTLMRTSRSPLCNGCKPAACRRTTSPRSLGVSIWSLRRWSRQYRKRTAAEAGAAGEPAVPAAAPEKLPAKPSSQPPVVDDGLIAAIARIELEISSLDKQRQPLKMAADILRQRSGATLE